MTTCTCPPITKADRAYLATRDLLIDPAAAHRRAYAQAKERADRLISATESLNGEECADEREALRRAVRDLDDLTLLLASRADAADLMGGSGRGIIDSYADEYLATVQAWRDAMGALLTASLAA